MTPDRLLNWDRDTALAVARHVTFLHPNWITTVSLALALGGLAAIQWGDGWGSAAGGAALVFASRWTDWIDGHVARATGRATNLGGLYDIAVGYVTMVLVMAAVGLRTDDAVLAWTGAAMAVVLRLVLMGVGWGLARRQRLSIVPWNPQKMLTPRMPMCLRRAKAGLDAARADYWILLFALAGETGLWAWAWAYTGVVILLTGWVLAAAALFVRRVPAGAPARDIDGAGVEAASC